MVEQIEIKLPDLGRGYHLITNLVVNAIPQLPEKGLLNVFIKHTSAALTLNENADDTVREDFETIFNKMVPEYDPDYKHTLEGADDMPAHAKASIIGSSVNIPISNGELNLGTWQGIYLCEFRRFGGPRRIVLTIYY